MKGLVDYIYDADPQDLKDCLMEHFIKHSKKHYVMMSELYYNDRAHFNQLSDGCKASIILYLAYSNSRETVVEAAERMLEDA